MFLKTLVSTLMCSAPFLALTATASPVESRATTSPFSLYAFGSLATYNIGGLPIFHKDGLAYVGNATKYCGTFVTYTPGSDVHTWWGSANKTLSPNGTDFNKAFYLPTSGATGQVGFANSTGSLGETDVFWLQGTFAEVVLDKYFLGLFTANPTGTDGVWQLLWNSEDGFPVTLKTTPAPNINYLKYAGLA